MRKNFGAKPYMYPMPVLIIGTYDENGVPNAMNAAWGTIADFNQVAIYLAKDHKTAENILARKAFTVSMADEEHLVGADYVGIVSGKNEPGKFEKAGFTVLKSEFVDAPLIEELPLAMECKLVSYDEESELLIGEILNVCAEERILGGEGKIDPSKLKPIMYDSANHGYWSIGNKVGNAFKDGKSLM